MDIYRFIREKIQEKSVFIEIGCHMGLDTKNLGQ